MHSLNLKTDQERFASGYFTKTAMLVLITLLSFSACSEREDQKSKGTASNMRCGAGKCGANMFDGNRALMKKKKNILSQMDEKDVRKDCVLGAQTTKVLYDCVRDTQTGKLRRSIPSTQEGTGSDTTKKCGAEKCGGKM